MKWTIPGTTLADDRANAQFIEQQFGAMFLGGGVVLSQITSITGLEAYTVQNWVKRGFLPGPQNKRYNLNQLCRIININMLKRTLPMERIVGLLSYINGQLDDVSDDIIDDSKLYFMFVQLASHVGQPEGHLDIQTRIEQALENYQSPTPDAKDRVKKVLGIMLTAWAAARLHEKAEAMVAQL